MPVNSRDQFNLRECATGLCQYIFEHGYKLGKDNLYELKFMHDSETHYFTVHFNMTNIDRHENLGTGKNEGKNQEEQRL